MDGALEEQAAVDPPSPEHHHRDVQGGAARAAVFGVNDGLVSNVALVLGVAGAGPGGGFVRLAGLVGLIGGAVSMAAGEYVSMRAQSELLERELDLERVELRRNPNVETVELSQLYQSRGMVPEQARELAQAMMQDPDLALQTHAREELGIDPEDLGSPVAAAVSSFLAFAAGAVVPLAPWFFTEGTAATLVAVVLAAVAALAVGTTLAHFTGRSRLRSALRQLAIATLAATVTWVLGAIVGVDAVSG